MAARFRQGRGNTPQLSCDLCRERKVKCDKSDPCTGCTVAGVPCKTIYRNRLPRGRHVRTSADEPGPLTPRVAGHAKNRAMIAAAEASNQELRERVEDLESLIHSMAVRSNTLPAVNNTTTIGQVSRPAIRSACWNGPEKSRQSQSDAANPDSISDYIRSRMSQERILTIGISSGSDIDLPLALQTPRSKSPVHYDRVMTQPASGSGTLTALGILSPLPHLVQGQQACALQNMEVVRHLLSIYFAHIDPILKIVHRPSVERWLLDGEKYSEYTDGHLSTQALRNAMCYAAASSITEQKCQSLLGKSKCSVTKELCRACETSLADTNLTSTNDMIVLQAFVLYLFARKSFDVSTSTWTLVSIAVRIGKKLRLYTSADTDSFFEAMKARLWLAICMLDYQTALSQRSEPLVSHEKVRDALSQIRHISDTDFGPTSVAVQDREDLTDMTFAYVLFQHQVIGRLLNFDTSPENESDETRQRYAREFEDKALGVLRFCDPESSQLAWFTWHATQCHVAIIRVSRLRPLCKSLRSESAFQCPNNDFELLRMTLRVLEKTQLMHTDVRGEPFRWYSTMPWPMLATAVSAYASCTDADLVLRSWPLLRWWYQQHEALISQSGDDPSRGVLEGAMQRASTNVTALSSRTRSVNVDRPNSSAEPFAHMGFDDLGPILDEQDTDVDTSCDLSLGVFDSLPWFADSTLSELDMMFFNDWDVSHSILE